MAEGSGFRDLQKEYDDKNAVIIGVSFDEQSKNRAFAEKYDFGFSLISDTDRKMGLAYGACSDPTASSADRVAAVIDPEGNIKEYEPKVNSRTYPAELIQRI